MTIIHWQLKHSARGALRGRWGIAIGISVIYGIIAESIQLLRLVFSDYKAIDLYSGTLLGAILLLYILSMPALVIGLFTVNLNISRKEKVSVSNLFDGFSIYWKSFGLSFMVGLFTLLWSLLLIVPGIFAYLRYSMAFYIMAENKDIGIMDAIRESKRITKGYKWDIFILGYSFIGWSLLCVFTLFIGFLWLAPYMQTTYATLYNTLKEEANREPEIVDEPDFAPIPEI